MAKKEEFDNPELREILDKEREVLYSEETFGEATDDKWEQAWSSKSVASVSAARLKKFPHAIPLAGMESGLGARVWGRILDGVFVGFGFFLLDMTFRVPTLARSIFEDALSGFTVSQSQYSLTYQFGSREIFSNWIGISKVFLLFVMCLGIYRLLFYVFTGRTLGQMFAGVLMTSGEGKYTNLLTRFLKAVTSTLSDASLIGPFVEIGVRQSTAEFVTATDAISGMRAVHYDSWNKKANHLVTRLTRIRETGSSEEPSSAFVQY